MRVKQARPELADALGQGLHNIGQAAGLTGVSAKMIRHYESIGLARPSGRTLANYRLYSDGDLHRLRFIRRARALGFSMERVRMLLALWDDPHRASAEVKQLAQEHAAELARKIHDLLAMQRALEALAQQCHGDDRPTCPILEDLASTQASTARCDAGH